MKCRRVLNTILILAALCHTAAAQPKKSNVPVNAPPLETVLPDTSTRSNSVLSEVITIKPEMPLGPQDVLKAYEIAMSTVAGKTSSDFSSIVQAEQANQITREQAEYLLQQAYQTAMMQYQVLSALRDVLKHDIDEAAPQSKHSVNVASSDDILVVPFPSSPSGAK